MRQFELIPVGEDNQPKATSYDLVPVGEDNKPLAQAGEGKTFELIPITEAITEERGPEFDPEIFGTPGALTPDIGAGAAAGFMDLSMAIPKMIAGGIGEAAALPYNLFKDPSKIGEFYKRTQEAFPLPWDKILSPEGDAVRQAMGLPFAIPSMVMDPIAESVFESPQVDPMSGEILSETQPELAAILKSAGEAAPLLGMVIGAGRSVKRGTRAAKKAIAEALPEDWILKDAKTGKSWSAEQVKEILRTTDETTLDPDMVEAFKRLPRLDKLAAIKGAGIDLTTVETTWLGKLLGVEKPTAQPGIGRPPKPGEPPPAEPAPPEPPPEPKGMGPAPAEPGLPGLEVLPESPKGEPPPGAKVTTSTFGNEVAADAALAAYQRNNYNARKIKVGDRWYVDRWDKAPGESPAPAEVTPSVPVAPPSLPPEGPEGPTFPAVERRQKPYEGPRERRKDLETRKKIDEMSHEERGIALKTDELTGLGSRRAFEEEAKAPITTVFDVHGQKWANDNLGHDVGDQMLKAVAEAIKDAHGKGFRISGDEFAIQSDFPDQAEHSTKKIKEILGDSIVEATLPDGTVKRFKGITISYGTGEDIDKAWKALNADKEAAIARGERSAERGGKPGKLAEITPAGDEAQGTDTPPLPEEGTEVTWTKAKIVPTREGVKAVPIEEGETLTDETGKEHVITPAPEALPRPIPGDRWTADRGAIPGEPAYWLDGKDIDKATAALVENDETGEWQARTPNGDEIAPWRKDFQEAAKDAENYAAAMGKEEKEDEGKDIPGVPGEIGIREEPVETKPDERGSRPEVEAGGALQEGETPAGRPAKAEKEGGREKPEEVKGGHFVSGMTRPGDFDTAMEAGADIGVVLPELTVPMMQKVYEASGKSRIFIDNGAFPAYRAGKDVDWNKVIRKYQTIVEKAENPSNLFIVAPDVLGKPAISQTEQIKWAEELGKMIDKGVNVIFPFQKAGPLENETSEAWEPEVTLPFHQTHWEALTSRYGDSIIMGIPANAEAWTPKEVGRLVEGMGPKRVHLLGISPLSKKYAKYRDEVLNNVPVVEITSDAVPPSMRRPDTAGARDLVTGISDDTEIVIGILGAPVLSREGAEKLADLLPLQAFNIEREPFIEHVVKGTVFDEMTDGGWYEALIYMPRPILENALAEVVRGENPAKNFRSEAVYLEIKRVLQAVEKPAKIEEGEAHEAGQVGEADRGKPAAGPPEAPREAGGERPTDELRPSDSDNGETGVRATDEEDGPVSSGERGDEDVPTPERGRPAGDRGISPRKPVGIDITAESLLEILQEAYKAGPKKRIRQNLDAIALVKTLESEERLATAEEQQVLAKYVGWGGLPGIFAARYRWNEEAKVYGEEWKELESLLTEEELENAQGSTINAHYTDPAIVDAIWKGLTKLGFEGPARIIEPALGIGHFIGLAPKDVAATSQITGIELDAISGKIARQLYQNRDIRIQGFQDAKIPQNFYDAAISNVPFSDTKMLEDRAYRKYRFSLHNYFFAKTLDKVRPGGIVAFITTHYTLDTKDRGFRDYLAERADLVGALRLPNTAFKKNAGTEVVTDVLFLRKKIEGEAPLFPDRAWGEAIRLELSTDKYGDKIVHNVNEYFISNPRYVLGRQTSGGSMYGANEYTVAPHEEAKDAGAIAELMQERMKEWKPVYKKPVHKATEEADLTVSVPAPDEIKEGAYYLDENGKLFRKMAGEGEPVEAEGKTLERFKGMIGIRDALRSLHRAQLLDTPDAELAILRENLNKAYDPFVKKYGYLHTDANANLIVDDPDYPLLLSSELWDQEAEKATKADIFNKRTVFPYKRVEKVETAQEALFVSMNELGRVDIGKMVQLTGLSEKQIVQDLAGQIYLTPQGVWMAADEYLSGNVREKLLEAESASKTDPDFRVNVEALKAVQPEDVPFTQIDVTLGSPWVPAEDVKEFIKHVLNTQSGVKVRHSPALANWHIEAPGWARSSVAATSTWGTEDLDAVDLISDALNLRTPTVRRKDIDGNSYVDQTATIMARQKQQELKTEFKRWLWDEGERRDRLHRHYNDTFNAVRLRTYDGSHLTLPGQSVGIELRPHQKNVIWRGITSGNTLMGHAVGAGKTFAMIGIAMEKRRLGLAKKILLAEPKHLIRQVAGEFLRLYPAANILVAGEKDFSADNRKKFLSRIATGDWDAVIITHEHFQKVPVSPETQSEIIRQEIKVLEDEILQAAELEAEEGGGSRRRGKKSGSRIIKQLEKAKDKLEQKLKELADMPRDEGILTFEELGVDQIFVDESHKFKNLFFATKMRNIAGLGSQNADRAFDMYVKTSWLNRTTNYRGVVFATGTPITNTMAEIFNVQRYLQPQELAERGMSHFDSWAANFGEVVSGLEIGVSGKYVVKARFASFVNLPELLGMFRSVADIQTTKMLSLPTPSIKGGGREANRSAPTPEYISIVKSFSERADAIRSGKVDPKVDNMLKITNDGRDAAIDMRRINNEIYSEDPQGKIAKVSENVYRIWKAGKAERHTQLIFCDRGTPTTKAKDKLQVYTELRKKLVAMGIPRAEIAFIHDAKNDEKKFQMFKDMNSGKLRVLIGSTGKMGEGMNAQKRLKALHHLDVPWTPGLLEQREGRILRQGNDNEEVEIHTYITHGSLTELSFDAYMWQTLETKGGFVEQVMQGNPQLRRMEDVTGGPLSFAELKAIATGNPIVMEKTRVDKEIRELQAVRAKMLEDRARIEKEIGTLPTKIEAYKARVEAAKEDMATVEANTTPDFEIVIGGKKYTDKETAGKLLNAKVRALPPAKDWDNPSVETIGTYRGLELRAVSRAVIVKQATGWALEIHAVGNLTWRARASESDLGVIASLNYAITTAIQTEITGHEVEIRHSERNLAEAKARANAKFEGEARLKALEERAKEIDAILEKGQQNTDDLGEGGEADGPEIPLEEDEAAEDAAEEEAEGEVSKTAAPRERKAKAPAERGFYRNMRVNEVPQFVSVHPRMMRDLPEDVLTGEWAKFDVKIVRDGDTWYAIEGKTGMSMSQAYDEKTLIQNMRNIVKEVDIARVDESIQKSIDLNGISPRYAEDKGEGDGGTTLYSSPLDPELIRKSFRGLQAAIEDIRDTRRIAKAARRTDLEWFNNAVNTPYYIFTEKFPQFAPVFERMRAMMQERDDIASELAERGLDYFAGLELKEKDALNKILIRGRYDRKVYSIEDLKNMGLDEKQIDGYLAVRDMLDHALEIYEDGIIYRVTKGLIQTSSNIPLEAIKDILIGLDFPAERATGILEVLEKIREAKKKGYVPFTRFGDWAYGLRRINDDGTPGELFYWGTEETDYAAAKAYKKMVRRFKRSIDAGKMRPVGPIQMQQTDKKKLLEGIGGFELEMLTKLMSIDPDAADALKEAVEALFQGSGFRKHFFESKDTPGFSTDMERALADYIIGLSGFVARTKGIPEMDKLAQGMSKYPKLASYYKEWRDYTTSPHEEYHRIRSGLFLYFLGGNPKSAAINLTQVLAATVPWLSQYVSEGRALKEVTFAIKTLLGALGKKPDGSVGVVLEKLPRDVREVVRRGVREGIISEQMIYEFMGIAHKPSRLRKLSKQKQRLVRGFGFLFSLAEKMNRFVTLIAAARVHASLKQKAEAGGGGKGAEPPKKPPKSGVPPPEKDPFDFGKRAVDETQFIYAKFNRPKMFRNWGALLGTFRSFVINYLELLARFWRRKSYRSVMAAFVMLWYFAGIKGIPFAEDIKFLLESIIGAFTHKKPDIETAVREWGYEEFGSAEFMDYLISGANRKITGIDIGRSVGVGDVIPLLGQDWEDPLAGIIGAPAEVFVKRPGRAYQFLREGKPGRALETISPEFLRNPLYAARVLREGVLDRAGGAIVEKDELSTWDIVKKGLGFMPTKVAKAYEREEAKRRIGERTEAARRDVTREVLMKIREKDVAGALQAMKEKAHGYRPKDNRDNIIFTGKDLPKSSADWIILDEQSIEQQMGEAKLPAKFRGVLRQPTLQRQEFLKMNKLYE